MPMTIWKPKPYAVINAPTDAASMEFFGSAGFGFWQTGGGCTAFGMAIEPGEDGHPLPDSEILITANDGDAHHPYDSDKALLVGLYADGDGVHIDLAEVESWEEALSVCKGMIDGLRESYKPSPYKRGEIK